MASRIWVIGIVAGWLLLGAAVLVIRSERVHGWLEDTAPLAEWLVAAGTFALAGATYYLARKAAEEARAVRAQAETVGEQVRLQQQQAEAALRPVVFPTTPTEWARKDGRFANARDRYLIVTNGGPGVALNVMGRLQRIAQQGGVYDEQILAGSIRPGQEIEARINTEWGEWRGTIGFLRYWDILGNEWFTDFTCTRPYESPEVFIEAKPPRRADEAGPDYPPSEWTRR